ncbi:MAG: hypothetical protein R3C11_21320 [Planctomycetaceae bacterium]
MLREGKLVAFVTETVYGLGARGSINRRLPGFLKQKSDPVLIH